MAVLCRHTANGCVMLRRGRRVVKTVTRQRAVFGGIAAGRR